MLRAYHLKWFFIVALSLSMSALMLRKEPFTDITFWHIVYFLVTVHLGLAACWFPIGFIITRNFRYVHNYIKHIMGILVSVVVSLIVGYLMHAILPANPLDGKTLSYDTTENIIANFSAMTFISLVCYVVFYGAHTTSMLQNTRMEKQRLEHSHLKAQIISLQQQISPHFLFNSLSTLRTMVDDQPTRNYIVQLSNVYRYVLKLNEQHLTPLQEEINFIKSYLYILNERFEDSLFVEMDINPQSLSLLVPPMSLQLLVENAIKHNMCSPERPLMIKIYNSSSDSLTIENNLQRKTFQVEATGKGIKNIVDRYKLLANKEITVFQNMEQFSVCLPLLKK